MAVDGMQDAQVYGQSRRSAPLPTDVISIIADLPLPNRLLCRNNRSPKAALERRDEMVSGRREIIVFRNVVPNLGEGVLNAGTHPCQHVGNLRLAQSAGASAEIADPRTIRKALGAAERERKHVARVVRRGGDDVVGRGELYRALGVLIENREILKMCIAIFDGAGQRDHREQLRERGALVLT